MKIIYTPLHKTHNPTYEVYEGEKSTYPEVPDRIEIIVTTFRKNGFTDFIKPKHYPLSIVEKVHHPNYVSMLRKRSKSLNRGQMFPSYFTRDTYAPITPNTYKAAVGAVDTAIHGAKLVSQGEKLVYALSRPPGHHAEKVAMGGYCYFNNAAVAADVLSKSGSVAILDIDFHHGNGTQNIFYERSDVFYVSLHADPNKKYPYISGFVEETGAGKGKGYNKNYPLPLSTTESLYIRFLSKAIQDIKQYKPKFLVVSAGFDTYIKDPIGKLGLDIHSYQKIGKLIATLDLPTLVVQEGGYMVEDLGHMALSLSQGLIS